MAGPRVFVGSSSEGKLVAEHFQAAVGPAAELTVWDQGIFGAGLYTMEALEVAARSSDFAVLVMTPDDVVQIRGEKRFTPRGNVLVELGLFMGALGVPRVLMLSPARPEVEFPSDLNGITRLPAYDSERSDGNLRAALTPAVLEAKRVFTARGVRARNGANSPQRAVPSTSAQERILASEYAMLDAAAQAQGWRRLRPSSNTTIRLKSPRGRRFSHKVAEDPSQARAELREFTKELRAAGLRVNDRIRRPI